MKWHIKIWQSSSQNHTSNPDVNKCKHKNIIFWNSIVQGVSKRALQLRKRIEIYRGHTQRFELSKCSKTHRVLPRIVMVLRPQQRKSVRPLLLHGDDHYRYRVSGHAPRVPHSTVKTKMTKKDAFTSSKTVHPLITLEKCASTSTPVSQVGG